MQYTINEIHGGEIKVTFEDKSWANIRVKSDDSPELIDEKVGAFTSEYVYKEAPNANIKTGDVRNTVDPVAAQAARSEAAKKDTPSVEDIYVMDWGNTNSYMEAFTTYMLALKLAAAGDTSLLDMINARLQTIQDDPEFSLDDLKAAFNDTVG